MRLSRPLGQVLLLLSLALVLAAGVASAQTNVRVEPYVFEADDGRQVEAELGRFEVPANRRSGSDETLDLAFVRFPSTSDDPGAPIVYLAGGPGGSGTGTAEGSRFDLFMALREVADVIAFDQRGTGMSERPPRCPHEWSFPLDEAPTREALLEVAAEHAARCAAFWREEGVDLAGYNTVESADDLDALRRVLDAEKIDLWGISYGTHLGLTMLRRHGEHVGRAVLAGVEGPDHTLKLPSNVQAAIERVDRLVQAEGRPALIPKIETVLARLQREPARATFTDPDTEAAHALTIGAFDVQWLVAVLLRGPAYRDTLAKLVTQMETGDFSEAAPLIYAHLRSGRLNAMSTAMDAASGASPERLARIERERERTLLGDAINFPYPAAGDALGVPDLGEAFRTPVRSDVPTLFISGTGDGRTPPSNAEEVLAGFPRGVHLVLEDAGHGDDLFLASPEILQAIRRFFRGQHVEGRTIAPPSEAATQTAAQTTERRENAGTLRVHLTGVPSSEGQLCFGLYDSEQTFLEEERETACLPIDAGGGEWVVEGLPHGTYAAAAFHDQDGDGELKKNWLGIPKEPVAFSNDAPMRFGPPKWEAARFAVDQGETTIDITLR